MMVTVVKLKLPRACTYIKIIMATYSLTYQYIDHYTPYFTWLFYITLDKLLQNYKISFKLKNYIKISFWLKLSIDKLDV